MKNNEIKDLEDNSQTEISEEFKITQEKLTHSVIKTSVNICAIRAKLLQELDERNIMSIRPR